MNINSCARANRVPAKGASRQHQPPPAHASSAPSSRGSLPNTNGSDAPPQGVTPGRPFPSSPHPGSRTRVHASIFVKFWKHSLLSRSVYFPTQQTSQLPPLPTSKSIPPTLRSRPASLQEGFNTCDFSLAESCVNLLPKWHN